MAWAAGNREFRQKITIEGTKIVGNHTDFPVAIQIPAGSDIFVEALTNGNDVLFTADDGVTVLDFEKSVWNKSGELGVFYVKTDLTVGSDVELYVYYSGLDDDQSDVDNTWASHYKGVYHFEETSGALLDSSGNSRDSDIESGITRSQGGLLGGNSWLFNSSDYVQINQAKGLVITGNLARTVTAYMYPTTDQGGQNAWSSLILLGDGSGLRGWMLSVDNAGECSPSQSIGIHYWGTNTCTGKTLANIGINQWHQYAGTHNGSTQQRVYLNGNFEGSSSYTLNTLNANAYIGRRVPQSSSAFRGRIGEIRVSSSNLGDAWIETEYNNILDQSNFLSFGGAEEELPEITTSPYDTPTVVEVAEFQPFGAYRQMTTAYTGGTASTIYYDIPVDVALVDTVSGTRDLDIDLILASSGTFTPSFFNIDTDFEISSSGFFLDGLIKYRNDFDIGFLVPGEYLTSDVYVDFFQGFLDIEHQKEVDVDFFLGFITDVGEDIDVDFDIANTNLVSGNLTDNYLIDVYSSTYSGTAIVGGDYGWYAAGWSYRAKITIDHLLVSGNLTDFPIAVKIDSGHSVFSAAQDSGNDILFTNSGGIKLDHELSVFDTSNTLLVAYVRTDLSSSTDTDIYMYYGNLVASDQSNSTAVWDSDFVGVWHLTEVPNSVSQDSTSNNNDLTHYSLAAGNRVDGPIGYAYNFPGSANDRLQKSSFSNWPSTTITAELLLKTTDSTKDAATFSYAINTTYNNEFLVFKHNKDTTNYVHNDLWDSNTAFNDGDWHHSASTWQTSGGTTKVFKDGQQSGGSGVMSQAGMGANGTLVIAQEQDTVGGGFQSNQAYLGQLAEIRISNIVRSDDWITTTYENLINNSSFLSFSAPESFSFHPWELEDYINTDTAVSGGSIRPLLTDVFSSVSGTQFNFVSDLYVSLCNTVPSGQVYKSPAVWPVGSGYYMESEATVSGGSLTGYDQDVYVSLEVMTTASGGGVNSDIRLHAMEILNFFLDVDEYATSASTMYVDIIDKRRIPISTVNSYFTISGTQVPVTFSGIEIPMTDLGTPIVASGYRMFYDPTPDFISDEPIEIVAHAENIVDDKLEETYYLLYGYNLVFDTPPSVEWPWGDDVVVWATATNKATCPTTSADGWIFSTVPRQHADLGATINPIGGEGLLPAVIYPQLRPNTFFYGANVKVVIKAKDLAGNEMEPFTLDFTIEDKQN